jgi:hypothetical protein
VADASYTGLMANRALPPARRSLLGWLAAALLVGCGPGVVGPGAAPRPGGVILLHDGGGDRSQTVAALHVLLDELQAAGWRFTLPPRVIPTPLRATGS